MTYRETLQAMSRRDLEEEACRNQEAKNKLSLYFQSIDSCSGAYKLRMAMYGHNRVTYENCLNKERARTLQARNQLQSETQARVDDWRRFAIERSRFKAREKELVDNHHNQIQTLTQKLKQSINVEKHSRRLLEGMCRRYDKLEHDYLQNQRSDLNSNKPGVAKQECQSGGRKRKRR